MEYILQRQLLRRPLTYINYGPTWDISDLDGGCDLWRRFQEQQVPLGRLLQRLKKVYRKDAEEFQRNLEKEAMAKSMWDRRAKDNADREDWWLEAQYNDDNSSEVTEDNLDDKDEYSVVYDPPEQEAGDALHWETDKNVSPAKDDAEGTKGWRIWSDEKDGKNKYIIDDSNDGEGEDDDDSSTIYSCARHDPPASHEVFLNNLPSTSTTSVDSFVIAACTLESMSLVYNSFHMPDDIEDDEWAGTGAIQKQPAPESTHVNDARDHLTSREFLIQYVHQAWLKYENQRRIEIVDKYRTLDVERLAGGVLSVCDWKYLPLLESYEECEHQALRRPTHGTCAYDRTPLIVMTNEDGQNFRLLEVRKILTEDQIAVARWERDLAQEELKTDAEYYDAHNIAALEGQTATERRTVNAARAWWLAEQEKRDVTYIHWQHAEDQEVELLKRQIKEEVDLRFQKKERSDAKWQMRDCARKAKAVRIQHFANLKLNLAHDQLHYRGSGRYVGPEYDVTLDRRALKTFLTHREDIEAMAYAISRDGRSVGAKAEAQREREGLLRKQWYQATSNKMRKAVQRRENEILARYAHRQRLDWMLAGSEEWGEIVLNWVAQL